MAVAKSKRAVAKSKQAVAKSKQAVAKSKRAVAKSKRAAAKSKRAVAKSKQAVAKSKRAVAKGGMHMQKANPFRTKDTRGCSRKAAKPQSNRSRSASDARPFYTFNLLSLLPNHHAQVDRHLSQTDQQS
jgi:hypothetical protein